MGFYNTTLQRMLTFLLAESELPSKGGNATCSMLHYILFIVGWLMGAKTLYLFADNCTGQVRHRWCCTLPLCGVRAAGRAHAVRAAALSTVCTHLCTRTRARALSGSSCGSSSRGVLTRLRCTLSCPVRWRLLGAAAAADLAAALGKVAPLARSQDRASCRFCAALRVCRAQPRLNGQGLWRGRGCHARQGRLLHG